MENRFSFFFPPPPPSPRTHPLSSFVKRVSNCLHREESRTCPVVLLTTLSRGVPWLTSRYHRLYFIDLEDHHPPLLPLSVFVVFFSWYWILVKNFGCKSLYLPDCLDKCVKVRRWRLTRSGFVLLCILVFMLCSSLSAEGLLSTPLCGRQCLFQFTLVMSPSVLRLPNLFHSGSFSVSTDGLHRLVWLLLKRLKQSLRPLLIGFICMEIMTEIGFPLPPFLDRYILDFGGEVLIFGSSNVCRCISV